MKKSWLRNALVFLAVLGLLVPVGRWVIVDHVRIYTITSGSMQPLISVGTKTFVVRTTDIKPNDIITFRAEGKIVTHIYGGENPDGTLMTRGMANREVDSFWPAPTRHDVVGKVVFHTPIFTASAWKDSGRLFGLTLSSASLLTLILLLGSLRRRTGAA